jgi:hypoxanthine-DNA glycosylase
MSIRHSLPPVVGPGARILILGSMPGKLSLQEQQYYAQPRNAFWQIMGQLFGAGRGEPYPIRLEILRKHRIALWDVLATCYRPGSMDADIRKGDAVANDFTTFLGTHPAVVQVFLNGATATRMYERLVVPSLADRADEPRYARLPSTSPANASMRLADKVKAWRKALNGVSG